MTTLVPVGGSGPAGDWVNSRTNVPSIHVWHATVSSSAKDDLLFADDDYFSADLLERRLAARPAGQPALETLRQWMIETIDDISSSRADRASLYWQARALRARLIDENDRLRGLARASYAPAERILAAAIAGDLRVEPDTLAPRLAAASAVTGLRELYDTREARSLGPEPTGADLIQLVNQVIDYATAGLAGISPRKVATRGPAATGGPRRRC